MITVIIPTLNEEESITSVIQLAKQSKNVSEVIVVDDKSVDNTISLAKKVEAKVIPSQKIGKGASMRDGLLIAKNEIIVYLDGDVKDYEGNVVEKLTQPIIDDTADFVKATFDREAGRVTELVAKPLFSILFPKGLKFSQPLSGMIAGKKSFFNKVTFEDDYGVDVGILMDMIQIGARVAQVNIGKISNKMKPWKQLGKMSREVSMAILKRVQKEAGVDLDSLGTINVIRDQMEFAIKETLEKCQKMAIFDLDETILTSRYIEQVANSFNLKKQLLEIVASNQEPFIVTKMIARQLKGIDYGKLIAIIDQIEIIPDTIQVIQELKQRHYIVGIISDSYDFVTQHIKNKIGADFALANELEFSNSIATGEIKIPSFFMRNDKSKCSHPICKSNAMIDVAERYKISIPNIVAIGNGENDICIIRQAGVGIAFCSSNNILNSIADQKIETRSFRQILEFAQ